MGEIFQNPVKSWTLAVLVNFARRFEDFNGKFVPGRLV